MHACLLRIFPNLNTIFGKAQIMCFCMNMFLPNVFNIICIWKPIHIQWGPELLAPWAKIEKKGCILKKTWIRIYMLCWNMGKLAFFLKTIINTFCYTRAGVAIPGELEDGWVFIVTQQFIVQFKQFITQLTYLTCSLGQNFMGEKSLKKTHPALSGTRLAHSCTRV